MPNETRPTSHTTAISRRGFLGATVAAAVVGAHRADSAQRRAPNVVFLFSDEHRYQSMAMTEMPEVVTPHMARFASQGVSFSHCISNYPVCSPYRAMLLTGRWPYQTGVVDNDPDLSSDQFTIAKAFKAAGYHTAYIGKWHLGGTRAEPFGFDHSLIWTGTNVHWDESEYHPANGEKVKPKGYNATLMTDQALEYMEKNASNPFFLMVSWNPPHSNFLDPPEAKKALYPGSTLPRRPNTDAPRGVAEGEAGWGKVDDNTYRGYHAHISAIDDELGRVLAKLDELGIADNTIVVYTSDHGSMQGSHGLGGKRQPFEESIRVPFMIRYPGVIPAGKVERALFGTIDIAPTLCELAGIRTPRSFEGRDFSPLLRGKRFKAPKSQLIMHIEKKKASGGDKHPAPLFRGLRTERHTYVELVEGGGMLFDNEADPYQQRNLFDDESQRRVTKDLHDSLKSALKKAHDPLGTAPARRA